MKGFGLYPTVVGISGVGWLDWAGGGETREEDVVLAM